MRCQFCSILFYAVLLLAIQAILSQHLFAQPRIAYIYPPGAERGKKIEVLIVGRQLVRTNQVIVSGDGVTAQIVKTYERMSINDSDLSKAARSFLGTAMESWEGTSKDAQKNTPRAMANMAKSSEKAGEKPNSEMAEIPVFTDQDVINKLPFFIRLTKNPSKEDLQLVFCEYYAPAIDRRQKDAMSQGVLVELTIDKLAEPGMREVRLVTPGGITPPAQFVLGIHREVNEIEPNDTEYSSMTPQNVWGYRVPMSPPTLIELPPQQLPVTINGQIRSGDVDTFRFHAKSGQQIVLSVAARSLIPYIADAVPGWFQPVITLFDSSGKQVSWANSYRFQADPLMSVKIPEDGIYTVEIRDSLFRGREDFVYRLSIGELPVITSMFPLGGRIGKAMRTNFNGINLTQKYVSVDLTKEKVQVLEKSLLGKSPLSRPVKFACDNVPEKTESEPNNSLDSAEKVRVPIIINGKIDSESDVDCVSFIGKKGTQIVLDVAARSLESPLDAYIELLDSTGKVIAENDDRADAKGPNIGFQTHFADPYLKVELPEYGTYTVRLYSTIREGGPDFCYRLRISEPMPDFEVIATPSSFDLAGNSSKPITFQVLRREGFEGSIRLELIEPNVPNAFRLEKSVILNDIDKLETKLSPDPRYLGTPRRMEWDAVSEIGGKEVRRRVTPADDFEQAFIYHHLVPAESFMLIKSRR